MTGIERGGDGGADSGDAAFAVGDGAFLFAPGGRGQKQVGVGAGGGAGEGFLHHHKFGALQGAAHGGLVGHGLRRVGAGNPQRFNFAIGGSLKQFHRCFAGCRGHVSHAPQRGDFGAVRGVAQVAVGGEQVGHAAYFAPAHRVGLARQRKRPGTGLANLASGEVQVDECRVFGRAAGGLVQALAIQTERGGALCSAVVLHARKEQGRCEQVFLGDAAGVRHHLRRAVAHGGLECLKALRVLGHKGGVQPAFPQHQVQHAVEQHHIGTGLEG